MGYQQESGFIRGWSRVSLGQRIYPRVLRNIARTANLSACTPGYQRFP
ncbi:hypothetical protein [Virgibacillus sediminis]|uniref:Uncharacterized protein n=1 Tax=Virgibacillus sediminis TaxID=202260 RepID=A0ABV7AA35_9BACI